MKILLVEDDENKRNQLRMFIEAEFRLATISVARSLQGAKKALLREIPDIVVLDMTLPNFDVGPDEPGGTTRIFGGRDLFRHMDRMKVVVPVIVVTQFETFNKRYTTISLEDLANQLHRENPTNYKGVVYYHAAIHDWKDELKGLITEIARDGKIDA